MPNQTSVNHWPRCTTLRQVRDHFVGHPERLAFDADGEPRYFVSSSGNRCALGMFAYDADGNRVGDVHFLNNEGFSGRSLFDWHDDHRCDPARWPEGLAGDEILDREWS